MFTCAPAPAVAPVEPLEASCQAPSLLRAWRAPVPATRLAASRFSVPAALRLPCPSSTTLRAAIKVPVAAASLTSPGPRCRSPASERRLSAPLASSLESVPLMSLLTALPLLLRRLSSPASADALPPATRKRGASITSDCWRAEPSVAPSTNSTSP
jgi:hypothetical protein